MVSKNVCALLALLTGAYLVAGGGFIRWDPPRQISSDENDRRFEPSSAVGGNWVTSWDDLVGKIHGYTSAWDPVNLWWRPQVQHRTPSPEDRPTGDLFLNWDHVNNRFVLVMLDVRDGTGGLISIWYRHSLDSQGTTWSTPIRVMNNESGLEWDFPSIAIATNGRIVVGASAIYGGNQGFYTVTSTDGGSTWSDPAPVVTTGGGVSRVVASGNMFHAFIRTYSGQDVTLNRYWSSDGAAWSGPSPVAYFTAPLVVSPGKYSNSCSPNTQPCNCSGSGCGYIHYASDPDAVGSTGLGWVVAFPVNNAGVNAINICSELAGCTTFTHSTDLFLHGIATSARGDYWFTYETYSGAPNRYLPLVHGLVYRTQYGSFLPATPNTNIDPKAWAYYFGSSSGSRCSWLDCFTCGDYMRPAANIYAAASAPFVQQSPRLTDLVQNFLEDPPGPPGPAMPFRIDSFPLGADLRPLGRLTPAHVAQLQARRPPDVSTLFSQISRR